MVIRFSFILIITILSLSYGLFHISKLIKLNSASGMTWSLLMESVMVMEFLMVVRVCMKDNDGVKCYAHGYPFTVLMVIIGNLYYERFIDERSTATK